MRIDESSYDGILNPYAIHNRTIRASIDDVNSYGGFASVNMIGAPSQGRRASLPWMWASFPAPDMDVNPPPRVRQGAWGRYMPFKDDVVKVAFDYDDTVHIIGYDVLAAASYQLYSASDGVSGWSAISMARDAKVISPDFRDLKPGEYDFMSIGGAYIFGQSNGNLRLKSGSTQIELSNSTDDLDIRAHVARMTGINTTLTIGQVRRELFPGTGQYVAVGPWNPDGSGQEFTVVVAKTLTGIETIPVAKLSLGNVANDLMVDLMLSSGLPKLLSLSTYDPTGLIPRFTLESDNIGNTNISTPSALMMSISAPLASFTVSSTSMAYTASTTYEIGTQQFSIITSMGSVMGLDSGFRVLSADSIKLSAATYVTITAPNVGLIATDVSLTGNNTITITTPGPTTITSSTVTITAPSITLDGNVVLSSAPTGFALNGSTLSASMAVLEPSIAAAITALAALAGQAQVSGTQVSAVLTPILSYLTTLSTAIQTATSPTVQL